VELSEQAEPGSSKTEAGAVSDQASHDEPDPSANTGNLVVPLVDPIDVVKNAAVADFLTGDGPTLEGKANESKDIEADDEVDDRKATSVKDTVSTNLVGLTEQAEPGSSKTEAVAFSVQASQDASYHSANTDNVDAPSVDPRGDVEKCATTADTLIGDVATLKRKPNESKEIKADDEADDTKATNPKDTEPANLVDLNEQAEQGIFETEAVTVAVQALHHASDHSANTDDVVAPSVDPIDAIDVVNKAEVADTASD
jgi:hypothetical protein